MKNSCALFFAALFLFLAPTPVESSCRDMDVARNFISPAFAAEVDATIQYFGHNFFQITTRKGTKIATDPLAPGMHATPTLTPHVATVGREHPNHNYVQILHGNPIIMRLDGALKGAAFLFDLGSLCIAHLGDLSHTLTAEQIKQMGRIDIALIPIGGIFTMPASTAREVLQQIKPKIAIPMHYRDNLYILEPFVQGLPTRKPQSDTLAVSKSSLPANTEIVVLRPKGRTDYW
ncbi:MAG: MBL fold metallo-hydrolase [Deltaproteobacteria bacterium]|nr:MBL fold metallo-hydrolase [Deltaproteobacteria bacterium]